MNQLKRPCGAILQNAEIAERRAMKALDAGLNEDAERLFRSSLFLLSELYGKDHVSLCHTLLCLKITLENQGKLDEAVELQCSVERILQVPFDYEYTGKTAAQERDVQNHQDSQYIARPPSFTIVVRPC